MEYREEEYIQLSGIQHFVFCRRQWALAYLEQQWVENERTADGRIMHRNVHDSSFREKRGDLLIVRGMKVSSARLGLSGECDAVEFRRSPKGVPIFGQEGTYTVTPVEYKRGKPKEDECDIAQLTAQAMCLEEMLCCDIPVGFLYYGASYQGGVYAGTAETSGRYCRRDAPALPEKAYAKGKADESLQCLFFEGYLSAGALRKENRRRLFAENAGNNGVKMP